jgi:bifunctional DNA-binding transcriptional regulator/antitoxin component of YhaV-PrlF toxin-antitoxin module
MRAKNHARIFHETTVCAMAFSGFDVDRPLYYIPDMVRTHITSKGQTTVPSEFRKKWKTSQVFWEPGPGGSAVVRPVPGAMSLLGIVLDALRRITSNKFSFGDAYLMAAAAQANEEIVTFDQGILARKDVRLYPLNAISKSSKK